LSCSTCPRPVAGAIYLVTSAWRSVLFGDPRQIAPMAFPEPGNTTAVLRIGSMLRCGIPSPPTPAQWSMAPSSPGQSMAGPLISSGFPESGNAIELGALVSCPVDPAPNGQRRGGPRHRVGRTGGGAASRARKRRRAWGVGMMPRRHGPHQTTEGWRPVIA